MSFLRKSTMRRLRRLPQLRSEIIQTIYQTLHHVEAERRELIQQIENDIDVKDAEESIKRNKMLEDFLLQTFNIVDNIDNEHLERLRCEKTGS